ncbi:MAG: dynamin family protein [Pirellulaceae bacterium]|nr:dynamin family protein [Pirellulaceae bacterium]
MKPAEYQAAREALLKRINRLREIRDELNARDPVFVNSLPIDVRQKLVLLDREASRLRNPDLTIAFVGGFSAGKSSLVNAFLGRYLLPESTKVTTAVPTFVRSTTDDECAELHYLNEAEVTQLDDMYRREISKLYGQPDLAQLPFQNMIQSVKPLANEGRGKRLIEQFETFHTERAKRRVEPRGQIVKTSIGKVQEIIRNETEAMFLDRVVLFVQGTQVPEDVVVVDLPGVSVPNPRHREITFRFVKEDAHAVVFVLMSTRLFDKDEVEIMELFRAGESKVAEKTFWALNRWDSLSSQQQRQTIADFEAKMQEFAIPIGYQAFRTNALHGLLSQLGIKGESIDDLALQNHVKDYEDALQVRYSDSHATAFQESQIPHLQEQVVQFLNGRLRQTTLRAAQENSRANFGEPLPHHLRRAKEADDSLITGNLKREEKEVTHQRVDLRFQERATGIQEKLRELRNEVAVQKGAILVAKTKELVDELKSKLETGPETDAYQIYKEIISERELRKYPYHFEIEMRIVDNLNTLLKRNFRAIVRQQVESFFEELTQRVQSAIEGIREDVNYNAEVTTPFDEIIQHESGLFCERVDGQVMGRVTDLDALLLFKPKSFWGLMGGNEILDGLEHAARMGTQNLQNAGQAIQEADFAGKTAQIRQTLTSHYLAKVREYHEQLSHQVFPIVINNMQEIEKRILKTMETKYRPALEIVLSKEAEGEFAHKRTSVEERSRRFRSFIEDIETVMNEMTQIVAGNVP